MTTELKTISSRQRAPLPNGTFRVLDAWDTHPSRYTVTVENGCLVAATNSDPCAVVHLDEACGYLTDRDNRSNRLGQLLDALSASTADKNGVSREEEFMLSGDGG